MKIVLLTLLFSVCIAAQGSSVPVENSKENAAAVAAAESAFKAHGGDKLKGMKTLVLKGTAEVSGSPSQTFPAGFVMIFSGDRYLLEISNPFRPLKQVFDGQSVSSSLPGFQLPPVNRIGLPMLQRFGQEGFKVEPLPEKSRKKRGFRLIAPDGFFCDFFTDEKTGAVKSYESAFDVSGRLVTTSVEVDSVKEVAGVRVPDKFAQRFELGTFTIYTTFKAAEVLVNGPVEDSVFTIE